MLTENEITLYLKELVGAIKKSDLPTGVSFFRSLFTQKERADIASRWALVKLLDQGVTQRKIAGDLGVSLCKITRGSRELKKENSPFKHFLALTKGKKTL